MQWHKLGRIFQPRGQASWIVSHAAVPIPFHLGADRFRIYFSSRNQQNQAQFGYIEIDLTDPTRQLAYAKKPALEIGDLGTFDDSGVIGDWIVPRNGQLLLYYTGWNRAVTVPFRNAIGLAISSDGGETFVRSSAGPILDRSVHDPCFVSNSCVLAEDGRSRMWYISGLRWETGDHGPKHYYHLKYAESDDGTNWQRQGTISIDFKDESEYAISRPCVVRDDDLYRMWYSYRGQSYRIGYAESDDGISWQRKDDLVGIDVSSSGWDSEMIEYPYVFDHNGRRYLLYNGNGYGQTGIGLAVLEK